jgi:replicative DNA helicase
MSELIDLVKEHTENWPNKSKSTDREQHGDCPKCGGGDDPDRFWLSNGKFYCRQCRKGFQSVAGFYAFMGIPNPNGNNNNGHRQPITNKTDLSKAPGDETEVVTVITPDEPPQPTTGAVVDTVYKNLEDYTIRGQQLPTRWLYDQGWRDGTLHHRPGFTIPSSDGIPRFRFTDGKKPKYMPTGTLPKGQTSQWYKFPDDKSDLIVLTNGQASVEVARYHGIKSAFAFTDGEGAIPKHLLNALKQRFNAVDGTVCVIALDGDNTGRTATTKITEQLVGLPVRIVDFGGNTGYDLADFCNQYKDKSLEKLKQLSFLPDNAKVVTSTKSLEGVIEKITNTERFIGVEEYLPIPFKSFHKYGGQMHIMHPGLVFLVAMISGGGKTSFLETWINYWLQRGFDVLMRGDEWSHTQYTVRMLQRYGGVTNGQFAENEMWKSEEARGIDESKRNGKKLPHDAYVQSMQISRKLKKWPGKIHYFPHKPYIEDTIEDMESRLHELRRNGRRVACAAWDYLSLFRSKDTSENNQPESVGHAIKTFSKRNRIASLAASQVKKETTERIKRGDNTPLVVSDLYYVRDDKFNCILGLNPVYKKMKDEYGFESWVFTNKVRAEILKNSDGQPFGHTYIRANLARFTWSEL